MLPKTKEIGGVSSLQCEHIVVEQMSSVEARDCILSLDPRRWVALWGIPPLGRDATQGAYGDADVVLRPVIKGGEQM